MGWIDVTEPFARPPRRPGPPPGTSRRAPSGHEAGQLVVDRGVGDLDDAVIGPTEQLDLTECTSLEVRDSTMAGQALTDPEGLTISAHRSSFDDCDLSRATLTVVRHGHLQGSKLIGTDLSGATIADTVFEHCTLRYANLRMANLQRVCFDHCLLDDVDGFELTAEDVSFPDSRLTSFNVDRLSATRVDLRQAAELSLDGARHLSGCLVAEHQLPALSYSLAFAVGLELEGPPEDP